MRAPARIVSTSPPATARRPNRTRTTELAIRLLPDPKHGKPLAVLLLVIAVLAGDLVFVHWWFGAPLLASRTELIELRDEEARLRATAQQREQVESRLQEVRAFEAGNPG